MPLPAGSDVIMQTHFHPSGKPETEKATLALYFADEPPSRQLVGVQVPPRFGLNKLGTIRAGDTDHTVTDSFTIPVDVQAWQVGGHAHYICREMSMTARLPDGTEKVLMEIDDWDLDWQDRYLFKEPLDLPAGTVLTTKLVYDNSAANPENPFSPPRDVRWGRQSTDEMGSVTLLVTAAKNAEADELSRSARRNLSPLNGRRGNQGATAALLMRLRDKDGDGKLQKSEAPERLLRFFDYVDADGDGGVDVEELTAALQRSGG